MELEESLMREPDWMGIDAPSKLQKQKSVTEVGGSVVAFLATEMTV